MKLKIEYVPKSELATYENNAKIHTEKQIEQIRNSIKKFGFNDPIAVWKDNIIIEGHGRLMAVMDMPEIETVPIIRLDNLTDEERKAYALVHNKLTMNTGFDLDFIGEEIEKLTAIDLTDFGFTEAEILDLTVDDGLFSAPTQEYKTEEQRSADDEDYSAPSHCATPEEEELNRELREYEDRANNSTLVTKRVILIYRDEEEMKFIRDILRLKPDQDLNVVYDVRDILGGKNAESKE